MHSALEKLAASIRTQERLAMISTRHRQQGWSLFEVAIALAVVSLTVCIALPSAASALERVRVARIQTELGETFLISARHAIAGGVATVVCPSGHDPNCGQGDDWSGGWMAFADLDGDRRFGAGDTLLRQVPPLAGAVRLYGSPERSRIVFQPHGGSGGSNASFTVCASRGARLGTLVLSNAGQFRFAERAPPGRNPCATF
ncbi:GspH/FimT family pseudopilin [Lysobacter sp. K5869]|uniref:GspH/FimT family pseudopilin n=1 Tax=Lysobacter sp. K5869 TaxID=2820808 RepID=UPI001C063240|nr:GspH/FimT family pseudopilin [Lysobacter sp. K5869]QWP79013.1 GspH/FimT family pseudopilin [Lysobacter sp. K5869]